MFWPQWLSSGVQTVEETAAPLSCCYTSHFKSVKYLQKHFKIISKYQAMIILLYACAYNKIIMAL
jgi:hypothetical protein